MSNSDLNPGDLVYYGDRGPGRYLGIREIERNGQTASYFEVEFKRDERIYVPLTSRAMLRKADSRRARGTTGQTPNASSEASRTVTPGSQVPPEHDPVQSRAIQQFIERLLRGVGRSPILKAFPTRAVKRIDLHRLRIASPEVPEALVEELLKPNGSLRFGFASYAERGPDGEESRALFRALRVKLPREAEQVRRETGLRTLWLAYPLLFVPAPSEETEFLVAPLFLWPLRIDGARLPEGHLVIARDENGGAPRFNRVARQWLRRVLDFEPPEPSVVDMLAMTTRDQLAQVCQTVCDQFRPAVTVDLSGPMGSIPDRRSLEGRDAPALLNAGLVGLIQWENMEILTDLEKLQTEPPLDGAAGSLLSGNVPPRRASESDPAEPDRYLVTDTDESQERAVWSARREPGVVVHGPPGTGKSQVIVNIVADALAHGQTVLVVCQKKAALDVVASRLDAAGLGDMFVKVDDAEADRRRVVETLRAQQAPQPGADAADRARLASDIQRAEAQFREFAEALFRVRLPRGLSYRQMLARLAAVRSRSPDLRPSRALEGPTRGHDAEKLERLARLLDEIRNLYADAGLPGNPWIHGRDDLRADRFEIERIEAAVRPCLEAVHWLDRWAGAHAPTGLEMSGDTAVIGQAVRSLAKTLSSVRASLVEQHGKAGPPATVIEAGAFGMAAEAARCLVTWQGSILRFVLPQFWRARRRLAQFLATHPWVQEAGAKAILDTIAARADAVNAVEERLASLARWLTQEWLDALTAAARRAQPLSPTVDALLRELPKLPVILRYRATVAGLAPEERRALDTILAVPEATVGRWGDLLRLSALMAWAVEAETQTPILRALSPELYEARRKELARLVETKRAREVAGILSVWPQKWREHDLDWRQALRPTGRGARRLREVFDFGLARGILVLRPCWLMNPGTVSQVLPLRRGLFDLVVFDEASQCPPEYAVAALHRAKRVVVAGDRKQLPPTMFFRSTFDFADDEEPEQLEEERTEGVEIGIATDAQDLLEIAQARLPSALLNVHYRSADPRLIAFSNAAFYGDRLEAPPCAVPVVTPDGRPALYLERVDGRYGADRTNSEEAARVVEFLRDLWTRDATPPTAGVVTFNEAQKEAIEDRLDQLADRDPEFRTAYDRERTRTDRGQDVGFFVRNLEAVQGDERDVILFSTTYGRREDGQFSRAFLGPINQSGGERRLNVAITRARRWVRIFTSLPTADLAEALIPGAVPAGHALGRAMLQLYLAYAERVSSGDTDGAAAILARARELSGEEARGRGPVGHEESEFELEVADRLRTELGLVIDPQVSAGAFRIDLGVRHPRDPGIYILGIECDGKAYHGSASARAYDYWRQRILEQERGWKIHRIWSTAWWNDAAAEVEKVRRRLSSLAPDTPETR